MRAFFAKERKGDLPKGTAARWADETPDIKKLPERVKTSSFNITDHFVKIAKSLSDPQKSPPIPAEIMQQDMIATAKEEKMKGMTPVEYRNEVTNRTKGTLQRNKQTAKAG